VTGSEATAVAPSGSPIGSMSTHMRRPWRPWPWFGVAEIRASDRHLRLRVDGPRPRPLGWTWSGMTTRCASFAGPRLVHGFVSASAAGRRSSLPLPNAADQHHRRVPREPSAAARRLAATHRYRLSGAKSAAPLLTRGSRHAPR
jgi:hypothetical protein